MTSGGGGVFWIPFLKIEAGSGVLMILIWVVAVAIEESSRRWSSGWHSFILNYMGVCCCIVKYHSLTVDRHMVIVKLVTTSHYLTRIRCGV